MKIAWRLLLLFVLLTIVLVACDGKEAEQRDASKAIEGSDISEQEHQKGVYQDKYDPPVVLSTVWRVDQTLSFKHGETIDNNVATRWAKDKLGIVVESLWAAIDSNQAFETKLRLALNAQQELPDVVVVSDDLLAQDLIDSGLFQEVGSLFDRYASPVWKEAMALNESVWNPYIRNGQRYGIPVLDYDYNHDYILWIREDWLEKLSLEPPRTMDELEKVMEAFKHRNPDGLSPQEVIPLTIGFKNTMSTWMSDPSWIFGAYGTLPEQWLVGKNGDLVYGSVQSGMKEGLQKLHAWYEAGYIPREAALWDESKASEAAVQGYAGIIPGPYWMSGWPLLDTAKFAEGARWSPYPIPTGAEGKAARHGTQPLSGVVLLHKNMAHPEAFFTYQNELFEYFANPEIDSPYRYGLFEGYDYALDADGKPLFQQDIPGGYVNTIRYLLVRDGARIPNAQMQALMRLADGKKPETRLELEIANNYGPKTSLAAQVLMSQLDISIPEQFTGPATKTMREKMDYLQEMELRIFTEIIYGEKDIAAFDTFVSDWLTSGGAQMTQEVNAWHQQAQKQQE